MGKLVKNLIAILYLFKFFAILVAFLYFAIWVIRIFNDTIFNFLNKFFCALPDFFDSIIHLTSDLNGQDVPMGYVYASLTIVGVVYLIQFFIKKLDKLKETTQKFEENKELEKRYKAQQKIKKEKEKELAMEKARLKAEEKEKAKQKKTQIQQRSVFFGLFEFNLDFLNYYGKFKSDKNELKRLKTEYCKMMVEKLSKKYKRIKFLSADKLFFMCDDYSIFSSMTKDLVKLFNGFLQVGYEKSLKTQMLLTFWAGNKQTNAKSTYNILEKINQLNYYNKVIVASGIYFRYQEEKEEKCFEFVPLGASKIFDVTPEHEDLSLNLYMIKASK